MFDSSWFIDFRDSIQTTFNGEGYSSNTQHLLQVLMSNDACNDTDQFGYPCCLSAHCIMTQRNSSGQLQYYPKNTPTFALFSLYDIYLLAPKLSAVAENLEAVAVSTGDNIGGIGPVSYTHLTLPTIYSV